MNWCLNHLQFTHVDWKSVLFTDESRFNLSHADGWVKVQHMLGESNTDAYMLQRNRFGEGSIMLWGGIIGGLKMHLAVH